MLNFLQVFSQDLPEPIENLEFIGEGSYILGLSQEMQSINQFNTVLFDPTEFDGFNSKVYGLLYRFLNNGLKVKWIIRSGKDKDEIDFTAEVSKVFPVAEPSQVLDFRTGAFVLEYSDMLSFQGCEDGVLNETIDQIITEFGNQVSVYRLEQGTEMDVRYTLETPPKIAVLDDGNDTYVHRLVLEEAELPFDELSSEEFFEDYSCYTFISQPHISSITNPSYIPSLTEFLNSGGNFFAQCIAIEAFENAGEYQTTDGIFDEDYNNFSYSYSNADMPIMQFEGDLASEIHGSLSQYSLAFFSNWEATSYVCVQNQTEDYICSVADVNGETLGGNIFYLAGHDFEGLDLVEYFPPYPDELLDQLPLNQQHKRIYYNALFVPANVTAACTGADKCICNGESIEIGCPIDSPIPGVSYSWSPSDFLSCSDCPNPVATPNTTTTYTLSTGNCNSNSVTVNVDDNGVIATITGGGNIGCDSSIGLDLNITFTGIGPWEFELALNGDLIETIQTDNNPHIYTAEQFGTYSISAVFNNQDACYTGQVYGEAVVTSDGSLDLDLGPDQFICPGDIITLGPNSSEFSGAEFLWGNGSTNSQIDINSSGEYILNISIGTCETSDTILVNLNTGLNNEITEEAILCEGDSLLVDADSFSANSFEWFDNSPNPSRYFTEEGNYELVLFQSCDTINYDFVLSFSATPPLPVLSDLELCEGGSQEVQIALSAGQSLVWPDGSTNPSKVVSDEGNYSISIVHECAVSDVNFNVVFVENAIEDPFLIPNAFSPNNDGINDVFKAFLKPDVQLESYIFRVYNRWGTKVFETDNIDGFWEGNWNAEIQETGVYVWYYDATILDCGNRPSSIFKKGNFTLIR